MEETLASFFHRIGPRHENPRLIVTAVDLQKIQAVAFDSYDIAVTPRHVVASSSLPPSFPATEIDHRSYWDGGLWSNTPLPEVLRSLRKRPSSDGPQAMTDCSVFIVDLFAPGSGFPPAIHRNYDVWALRDRVLFQDKASYDGRCAGWVNECIQLVRGMRKRLQSLPADRLKLVAELDAFVDESYRNLYNEKRLHLDIYRIIRSHRDSDEISRDVDFSPERINSLINQGRTDTSNVLATIVQHTGDRPPSDTRLISSSEPA
jgi:NTE family protein